MCSLLVCRLVCCTNKPIFDKPEFVSVAGCRNKKTRLAEQTERVFPGTKMKLLTMEIVARKQKNAPGGEETECISENKYESSITRLDNSITC